MARWYFAILVLGFFLAVCLHGAAAAVGETQRGLATWYGSDLDGNQTASGEIFHCDAFTAAHRTLPFNSVVEVRNLRNGLTVQVRINDRGPFGKSSRIIDLAEAAARRIGLHDQGTVAVEIRIVKLGQARHARRHD